MVESPYVTEEELAKSFGITVRRARDLRIEQGWPHLRFGRFSIRYTPMHVALIEDLMTVRKKSPRKTAGLPGQTVGSQKRSA